MSKVVFTGIESSGKSLLLSREAEKVRRRNTAPTGSKFIKNCKKLNNNVSKKFIMLCGG